MDSIPTMFSTLLMSDDMIYEDTMSESSTLTVPSSGEETISMNAAIETEMTDLDTESDYNDPHM